MLYSTYFVLPWGGALELQADDDYLLSVSFSQQKVAPNQPVSSAILRQTIEQLEQFFAGKLDVFDLPLAPKGTAFQQQVWHGLQKIPFGQTWSYKDLAEAIGKPTAMRAVGNANGKNPWPIIVPCHRVVAHDGGLGGYTSGLENKKRLLDFEGVTL